MIKNIFILLVLFGVGAGVIYFLFFRQPEAEKVEFNGSIKSSFGEMNEYVNKQAKFSIQYPNSWNFQIKEIDDTSNDVEENSKPTKGIRLRGKKSYIDIFWGEEYKKGGCKQKTTLLQLDGEQIEVCDFVQDDQSEVWNQIVKDRGDYVFWASAYAASPSAQTRQEVIDIFSTLKFFE